MEDRDQKRTVQPREPRRGSTVEMVDRIRAEEMKAKIVNPAVKVQPKEPPSGR